MPKSSLVGVRVLSTPIFLFCSVLVLSNLFSSRFKPVFIFLRLHLFSLVSWIVEIIFLDFPWILPFSAESSFCTCGESSFPSFFFSVKFLHLSISRYENYFLAPSHFAILKVTVYTEPSQDNSFSLKILLFLSFQIDHKIEKGIILHRIKPHPAKGFPLFYSNSWPTEPGMHHATLHSLRKYHQRDDAKCLGIGDPIAPTKTTYVWNGLWHQSPQIIRCQYLTRHSQPAKGLSSSWSKTPPNQGTRRLHRITWVQLPIKRLQRKSPTGVWFPDMRVGFITT